MNKHAGLGAGELNNNNGEASGAVIVGTFPNAADRGDGGEMLGRKKPCQQTERDD